MQNVKIKYLRHPLFLGLSLALLITLTINSAYAGSGSAETLAKAVEGISCILSAGAAHDQCIEDGSARIGPWPLPGFIYQPWKDYCDSQFKDALARCGGLAC